MIGDIGHQTSKLETKESTPSLVISLEEPVLQTTGATFAEDAFDLSNFNTNPVPIESNVQEMNGSLADAVDQEDVSEFVMQERKASTKETVKETDAADSDQEI